VTLRLETSSSVQTSISLNGAMLLNIAS